MFLLKDFLFNKTMIVGGMAFLLLIDAGATQKSVVRSIAIAGNHAFTSSQLLNSISITQGSVYLPLQYDRAVEAILHLYRDYGYCFARVRPESPVFSPDTSSVDIGFTIEEGEKANIGALELEGNTAFAKDDILQKFDTRVGGFLDRRVLEHDIDQLLSRYERTGYPFASVAVAQISTYRDSSSMSLRVILRVDEGERIQIGEIRVVGNKETSEHVVVREAGVRIGDYYDQERIDRIPLRLTRMNIFSRVEEPQFYVDGSGVGVLSITVQEGNTNTFDGIVGYVPSPSTDQAGYLTGLVNVTMKNLFGAARKLDVHWQRDDQYSQEIAARYIEPWIFNFPIDVEGAFQQRQQDTTYVRREAEMRADVHLSETFTIGGLFTVENVIPSSNIVGSVLSESRTVTTGAEIRYDSRDDILSPTSGVSYRNDYQIGNKKIYSLPAGLLSEDQFTVQKISFDAEVFIQPILHQVAAFGLHGRQLTSDALEAGDLYRFGGATTLRGYKENQFLGSRIGWTNAEYRFLLARRSFFFGFFDSGYYLNGITDAKGVKYGYGVGIRMETSLGNIGISFALGQGDSFSQGKLHVGLVNDF